MQIPETGRPRYGWHGTVSEFLQTDLNDWLHSLQVHHNLCMNMPPDGGQTSAWRNSYSVLQSAFSELIQKRPYSTNWHLVFEYELPRERGRRPDAVVLASDKAIVLEFKDAVRVQTAHADQVRAYARDLSQYHAASHDLRFVPVVIPTLSNEPAHPIENVEVVPPNALAGFLDEQISDDQTHLVTPEEWLSADYAPLPFLVTAARLIFRHEPLPDIRRAHSAGIPQAVEYLVNAAKKARDSNTMHLALVTGVPGSGKTLVGLKFVYENHFGDTDKDRSAVFLSGNGPLVEVLQHALKSTVFVQGVHGFLHRYGGTYDRKPGENIWVYDEAQRAWDAGRSATKRGQSISEPEDFLRVAEMHKDWALMVGLIGDGQEIHLGEEAGLGQWNDAIDVMQNKWIVHCPRRIADLFGSRKAEVVVEDSLDLTVSLRSHVANDVQEWIDTLLGAELNRAHTLALAMKKQGFDAYVTRDLEKAKAYLRERYEGSDKKYGIIASSKARLLPKYGVMNDYLTTRRLRVGPWYNDPPESSLSCCRLQTVATEFACQGLELDMPLVAWGEDLTWDGAQWVSPAQKRSTARDPHQLRINSYRVLLSRGRDGFVIFLPPESRMDSSYRALLAAGIPPLE